VRIFVAALLLAAGCLNAHDSARQEVHATSDCVACHQPQYLATTNPVHPGNFPTTCVDCHLTTNWMPALSGPHPEPKFSIADPAIHGVPCQSCHDINGGPSTGGANTMCTSCHPQAVMDPFHGGVPTYAWDANNAHFCLTCHPNGTAPHHPESQFPIASGAHAGIACGDCHDKTLGVSTGGMNTNCIRCHTANRTNGDHSGVRNYTFDATMPHFCLTCHPRGRAG
jgi:hypothetical protein